MIFRVFKVMMQFMVIANTFILCLDRHPISDREVNIMNTLNLVFAIVFLIEMVIKMIGSRF
jgi:hypothetical protein